jgi:hypothetical protein
MQVLLQWLALPLIVPSVAAWYFVLYLRSICTSDFAKCPPPNLNF